MIVLALLLAGIAVVPLTGGQLSNLRHLQLRHSWLMPTALVVQTAALYPLASKPGMAAAVHIATYVMGGWWVWENRHVRGLPVAATGAFSNFAAIATNSGVMPAHPRAAELAGLHTEAGFTNSSVSHDAPLWFLGDVFAIPHSWPLANVFSVGDVLLLAGTIIIIYHATRRHTTPPEPPVVYTAETDSSAPLSAPPARRRHIGPSHTWTLPGALPASEH